MTALRMEEEAHVTELGDLLNSNLLKRQQELTSRLQQADVEVDRYRLPPGHINSKLDLLQAYIINLFLLSHSF